MSVNENIGLKMTISNRKQTQIFKLKVPTEEDPEPKLGEVIDRLPPCLDPNNSKDDKFSKEIMGKRYFEANLIGINPFDLAHKIPLQVMFLPSEEVLKKLIKRTMQVDNYYQDLWEGFKPVFHKDGSEVWVPNSLLLMD